MTRSTSPSLRLAVVIAALAALGQAAADDDHFRLDIGAFAANNTNGTLRLDDSSAPITVGTAIIWDRDLGGDTSLTTPRIEGYWRFADQHRIDFGYVDISRTGNITTTHDITIGDTTFPSGTVVNAEWGSTIVKLAYAYSLYRVDEIEVAVSAGLHSSKTSFAVVAPTAAISKTAGFTAPLPVVGLRIDYALTERLHARVNNDLFFLDSLGGVSGSLDDFEVQLEHRSFEHLGFGVSVNRTTTQFSYAKGTTTASADSEINGFTFYATFSF
jgi:hypothetical protein